MQTLSLPVRTLLEEHFGGDPLDLPIVTKLFEPWDHINVQAGLNAYLDHPGRKATFIGATVPPPSGGSPIPPEPPRLASLLSLSDIRMGSVDYIELPVGEGPELACILLGLILVTGPGGPLAIWVRTDSLLYRKMIALDVQAHSAEAAQAFFDEHRELKIQHNLFKGKVVKFGIDSAQNITVEFGERANVKREELVLPEKVLKSIEGHAIGIAHLAEELQAASRHLKRGVLLYGPPGTGKTLTIRYITSQLPEATQFILTGTAMGWLKFVAEIAAELAPTVIVLDDVDLIAEDRNLGGMSPRRHLFDLLDAMDGLHEDLDVLFICTTNRAESLEKAISARPGRVDQAVEIPLPDADCRLRLFHLNAKGLPVEVEDLDSVIARTEGVTASFMKELLRRAAVIALGDDDENIVITDLNLHSALDTLLDPANPLTSALRGIETEGDVHVGG